MSDLDELRHAIRTNMSPPEDEAIARLVADAALDEATRAAIGRRAIAIAEAARSEAPPPSSQVTLGHDIEEATRLARAAEGGGGTFSYKLPGEVALTEADARRNRAAHAEAVAVLAAHATSGAVRDNPGLSIKLSALHPRYEPTQRGRVRVELAERALALATMARGANLGFGIDAEDSERLDLSLDVIAAVLRDPRLAGWDGFGVTVQAYEHRAAHVIDWLALLAEMLDRRVIVRLVKGSYWNREIKRAQQLGLSGFPVFTRKPATEISYIANIRRLFAHRRRLFPQFATQDVHAVAAVLEIAGRMGVGLEDFEFQRLYGVGGPLHSVLAADGARTRVHVPVGGAPNYSGPLVPRLPESGAGGVLVDRIADHDIPAVAVVADPFEAIETATSPVALPDDLFAPSRSNSRGLDPGDHQQLERVLAARERFARTQWSALSSAAVTGDEGEVFSIVNPADGTPVGTAFGAGPQTIALAISTACDAAARWAMVAVSERAAALRRAADLFELQADEFNALLAREAGKTLLDAVEEVREAVDFLRYYAAEAEWVDDRAPLGVIACISARSSPLAGFTGQVAAALVTGNTVLAKPAEATPLVASRAVALLVAAGVPDDVIQLLPGRGATVGAALVSDPRIDGVAFTGSLATAHAIDLRMAEHLAPGAPLIAATGGINVMVADATAPPAQVVRAVLASAFQSAGQRCSALRLLYLDEETAPHVIALIEEAMDELRLGDPWELSTDLGPVVDRQARDRLEAYVAEFAARGALLHRTPAGPDGNYVAPALVRVGGISEVAREIFGPVLHVATFRSGDLDQVIAAINASGYGLTFGLHTCIDSRIAALPERIRAGNIFVNRRQVGGAAGSQPFGGEGLSGTGPKAGGPNYLKRFWRPRQDFAPSLGANPFSGLSIGFAIAAVDQVRLAVEKVGIEPFASPLPGPIGESNVLYTWPRGVVLCLGPDAESAAEQARLALELGNGVLVVAPGATRIAEALGANGEPIGGLDKKLAPAAVEAGLQVDAVMHFGDEAALRPWRQALARREGPIVPLITCPADAERLIIERHVCIDTTASGGNAALPAGRR